jgi:hypothetical protein
MDNEMSSEVTKEEVTQEALDAAAEEVKVPVEVEPTVPLHVHTALRSRAQDAEIAQARAEGKLEALQSQNVATATISPLDAEIARQRADGVEDADMQISASIMKADKAYEQNQATLAAEASAKQELGKTQVASMNTAKLVHDDWQGVVNAGQTLLSQGEAIDIAAAGDNFGAVAYEKCKAAIERNKVPVTQAAPEIKLSESEADLKAEADAKEAEELKSQEALLKDKVLSDDPAIDAKMRL